MEQITFKEITEKEVWESFIASHPEANFLHSWYWGDFHKALGKNVHRRGAYAGEKLVGVMLMIVEEAKRGRHILVPAGPVCDWSDQAVVSAMVSEMHRIGRGDKAVLVRVRPELGDSESVRGLFKRHGFIPAPTHLHAELTSVVDLEAAQEAILQNMRKQTRSEVKKAEKLGIEVSTTTDPEAIRGFYELELETARRQHFVPFSYKFLHEQFKVFAEAGHAVLYTATHEGHVLAQAFIIFYGNQAAYHYGVSTDMGRKYPGAYALQWRIMQDAKAQGLTRYNLWGVAPVGATHHRFHPISIFKRGFGGSDFAYIHAQDLVINRGRYALSYAVEYVRNRRRHL